MDFMVIHRAVIWNSPSNSWGYEWEISFGESNGKYPFGESMENGP